jgi:hypothetical protein
VFVCCGRSLQSLVASEVRCVCDRIRARTQGAFAMNTFIVRMGAFDNLLGLISHIVHLNSSVYFSFLYSVQELRGCFYSYISWQMRTEKLLWEQNRVALRDLSQKEMIQRADSAHCNICLSTAEQVFAIKDHRIQRSTLRPMNCQGMSFDKWDLRTGVSSLTCLANEWPNPVQAIPHSNSDFVLQERLHSTLGSIDSTKLCRQIGGNHDQRTLPEDQFFDQSCFPLKKVRALLVNTIDVIHRVVKVLKGTVLTIPNL